MEQNKEKDHLLALKVMRLTKPSLVISQQPLLPVQLTPAQHDNISLMTTLDPTLVEDMENFTLSELLTLPQNFGNIFLGETFSSYISIHNDSRLTCKDIIVKADLQTSSQRITLSAATTQPVPELLPDDSIDDVIHHEVKELGTHILVCAVNYTTPTDDKMYFRKFFKFNVFKPLDVKTKFYNAESDEVYLEAQIQNITQGAIYMERVALEPSTQYTARELNCNTSDSLVFGRVSYMNPLDVRQYLYCLTPLPHIEPRVLKGVTNIGKLDIVWRTNMAERGRLQTSALQRVAPGYGDIRVTVESVSDAVPVNRVFNIQIKVTNCCERTMDLLLVLQNSLQAGLLWSGVSGKQLGRLEPCASTVMSLTLTAIRTGLLTISGLWLTDTFLKRTYEHDEVAQVYVYDNNERCCEI